MPRGSGKSPRLPFEISENPVSTFTFQLIESGLEKRFTIHARGVLCQVDNVVISVQRSRPSIAALAKAKKR
jgi:hypothetical protein